MIGKLDSTWGPRISWTSGLMLHQWCLHGQIYTKFQHSLGMWTVSAKWLLVAPLIHLCYTSIFSIDCPRDPTTWACCHLAVDLWGSSWFYHWSYTVLFMFKSKYPHLPCVISSELRNNDWIKNRERRTQFHFVHLRTVKSMMGQWPQRSGQWPER